MENKELLTLAGRLKLPKAVRAPLAAAAKALPEGLPVGQLAEPEAAAAACRTEERYRREGIQENVFRSTMDCFRRFLEETHARTGQWAFDRGFWTWRQTAGLLFRLGTLEFEYRRMRPGPQPEGIEAEAPVLSVHIPSDAVLEREKLDSSYNMALRFFSQERRCPWGRPRAMVCSSWLLAPALDGLLPENSGIRRFAGDYRLYDVDEEDQEFYEWLFGGYKPLEELPEHTSLQRAVKARLAAGGRLGMARGVLARKAITENQGAMG